MKLRSKGCNAYLIEDRERKILIDTGTDGKLLASQIDELDAILITHAHFDHVAGAWNLERVFGCPVYVHPEDIPYVLGENEFHFGGILGAMAKLFEKFVSYKKSFSEFLEMDWEKAFPGHGKEILKSTSSP